MLDWFSMVLKKQGTASGDVEYVRHGTCRRAARQGEETHSHSQTHAGKAKRSLSAGAIIEGLARAARPNTNRREYESRYNKLIQQATKYFRSSKSQLEGREGSRRLFQRYRQHTYICRYSSWCQQKIHLWAQPSLRPIPCAFPSSSPLHAGQDLRRAAARHRSPIFSSVNVSPIPLACILRGYSRPWSMAKKLDPICAKSLACRSRFIWPTAAFGSIHSPGECLRSNRF